jgi:hypothetical protein
MDMDEEVDYKEGGTKDKKGSKADLDKVLERDAIRGYSGMD